MSVRILVADDSITIQKVVALAFEREEATVQAVGDGHEALDLALSLKPDILLADVFMPGLSGYEVCERIKTAEALSDLPVILLVGAFEPFDAKEARRVGCDAHLTKPFDPSELVNLVWSLLGHKEREALGGRGDTAAAKIVGTTGMAVSSRVRESFLGTGRILDLFDAAVLERPQPASDLVTAPPGAPAEDGEAPALTSRAVTEETERVLRCLAPGIVREIAERLVPSIAEEAVRRHLGRGDLSGTR